MGGYPWLVTVVAVLIGVIATYVLTRQGKMSSKTDELIRKTTTNERDIGNLAAVIQKNDVVNRLTRMETSLHDLNQSVQHNIPELFAKWDQLVTERRRNGDG
jgi:uncharacterized membrane-anchored protein YhcB (DUF1043 family)